MPTWFDYSVIYEIDVENYLDGDGDGCGDFEGLILKLDYLRSLGVDCLWLLPIFDTPDRDNGYDVRDFYRLNTRIGDFGDFALLLEEAEDRGIRILIDLPVNHTSIDHAWFQEACTNPDSKYHDYYVWVDEPPEDGEEKLIFGEQQGGNWAYVEELDKYYYHTFYSHEADLDFSNPAVRNEIEHIMRFWLRQGIWGFRMDAVPHMIREKGNSRFEGDPHDALKQIRGFVDAERPGAILLAETDAEPDKLVEFFGNGDELNLLLNFYLCNYLYLAFARKEAEPVEKAFDKLPDVTGRGQWANFLRNFDELDLERLEEDEFQDVMEAFAPDENMRIFGRGIRRRVAPMLEDDRRRLELAYSLLLTMPGTPVLLYGDEIAMGDDLSRDGRDSVRLLMQWSNQINGGFSRVDPDEMVGPVIDEGPWGYRERNVADQRLDAGSFLNWMSRAIHRRLLCPQFGFGHPRLLDSGDPRVLVHACFYEDRFALAVHNLSEEELKVTLEPGEFDLTGMLEVFGDDGGANWKPGSQIVMRPYGYRWFQRIT